MLRPTRIRIQHDALIKNIEKLKVWNGPGEFFCPMVKANAYGHGDIEVAHAVEECGASALGVALVEEGLRLRAAGIRLPILVFAPFDKGGASAMFTHQLTPVLTRFEDLAALAPLKGKTPLSVHVKFNTGMGRLGFDSEELPRLREELTRQTHLQVSGLCTHLTHGEEAHVSGSVSETQLAKLNAMCAGFTGVRHAHKSASLAALCENGIKKPSGVGARPGISLYGLPYEGSRTGPGLLPVLIWSSALARVHGLDKGEPVGYGARWRAPRPSVVGVVPVGYGDGYMRALAGKSEMLFRGARVPVVGSVCMDYIFLDLTAQCADGRPQPGEEIILIGRQGKNEVTAGELAEKAGTIAYEIVTNISARVAREVV